MRLRSLALVTVLACGGSPPPKAPPPPQLAFDPVLVNAVVAPTDIPDDLDEFGATTADEFGRLLDKRATVRDRNTLLEPGPSDARLVRNDAVALDSNRTLYVKRRTTDYRAAIVARSSTGHPVPAIAWMATLIKVAADTQATMAWLRAMAQRVATNGAATGIVVFTNGNGFAVYVATREIAKEHDIELFAQTQFMKAGTFNAAAWGPLLTNANNVSITARGGHAGITIGDMLALLHPTSPRKIDPEAAAAAKKGFELHKAACEKDPKECPAWSRDYEYGRGVEKDLERAFSIAKGACDAKVAEACSMMGTMLVEGTGTVKDPAKGSAVQEEACSAGFMRACVILGTHFRDGKNGRAPDRKRAYELYEKACKANPATGCSSLAYLYEHPEGTSPDHAKSLELYDRACTGGDGQGCNGAGWAYENALGVAQDYAKATSYYTRGCDLDAGPACNNLGVLFDHGRGLAVDPVKATKLYERACDVGDGYGCNNAGVSYRSGRGVALDISRARALFKKACDKDFAAGCTNLGALAGSGLEGK